MRIEDKAILSTWLEYLRSLKITPDSVSPSLNSDPASSAVITGINENLYNSVFLQNPIDGEMLIQELRALHDELNLQLTAWVTDVPAADQLHRMLKTHFHSPGAFYGMLLDLAKANVSACPPNVSIEVVNSRHQAEVYAEVFCKTFHFPNLLEPTVRWAVNQYQELNRYGISYIAKVEGVVAGVCSLIIDREFQDFKTGGFYNACVLPEFRRRGVGTAMACHRVKMAKELGLQYVSIILMSDALARSYCEQLGFENFETLTPYYINHCRT